MNKVITNLEKNGNTFQLPMDFVAGLIDALLSQKVTKLEHDKATGKLTITFGTGDLQSTQETTIQIPEYEVATTSKAGLMSATDKTKLDGYPTKTGSTTTFLRGDGTFATPPNTDTHHEGLLVAGASNTTTNAATTNGNTYLKFIENKVKKSGLKISGSGATTVTSDANGNITINSAAGITDVTITDSAIKFTKADGTTKTAQQYFMYHGSPGGNLNTLKPREGFYIMFTLTNAPTTYYGGAALITFTQNVDEKYFSNSVTESELKFLGTTRVAQFYIPLNVNNEADKVIWFRSSYYNWYRQTYGTEPTFTDDNTPTLPKWYKISLSAS